MIKFKTFSLNLGGRLLQIDKPQVMGIVNVTPDSFYGGSRVADHQAVEARVESMLADGVDMIDIGAYSSRPGAADVAPEEEIARLRLGMKALRQVAPHLPVSVDTFRADVARVAVEELGVDMVNDISGGNLDNRMIPSVAQLKVPYILMHMRGTPATMQQFTDYVPSATAAVAAELSTIIDRTRQAGICDIIVDPGFGFSKTLDQNYELLRQLPHFIDLFDLPLLVGVSRKSMITKLLNITADEALTGTTIINTMAILNGAAIIRVHDVKPARQAVELIAKTYS